MCDTRYGVYDTKEHCWLGDKDGPLVYVDEELAIVAARVLDVRLQQPAGRLKAKLYTEDATVLKDEKSAVMSAEDAIDMLEDGRTL